MQPIWFDYMKLRYNLHYVLGFAKQLLSLKVRHLTECNLHGTQKSRIVKIVVKWTLAFHARQRIESACRLALENFQLNHSVLVSLRSGMPGAFTSATVTLFFLALFPSFFQPCSRGTAVFKYSAEGRRVKYLLMPERLGEPRCRVLIMKKCAAIVVAPQHKYPMPSASAGGGSSRWRGNVPPPSRVIQTPPRRQQLHCSCRNANKKRIYRPSFRQWKTTRHFDVVWPIKVARNDV